MKKMYQIAVVLDVDATTYRAAMRKAEDAMGQCIMLPAFESIAHRIIRDFEYDFEGQRVLYLHSEKKPLKIARKRL
jgi:hypothetical protein